MAETLFVNPFLKYPLYILLLLPFFVPALSHSTSEYAQQTGFECKACHADATGEKLTKAGENIKEGLKMKGLYRPLFPIQKVVRLIIGYFHLLTAIAWFGIISYVHTLLKPAYAPKGLPRGKLILGWVGIIVLSVIGVLLTISRIPTWKMFYTTRFGILLSIKILLFMIMVASAAIVTFVIGPKMRKKKTQPFLQKKDRLTLEDLQYFDGKENRPTYLRAGERSTMSVQASFGAMEPI